MNSSPRTLAYMQMTIMVLMVLTVGLLLWHRYGMERVVSLVDHANGQLEVGDDRINSGTSVASLHQGKGGVHQLRCHLTHDIQWPNCRFMFTLSRNGRGLDLSEFDTVSIDAKYQGPGRHTLRIMLLNFEPSISTIDDTQSLKVNEVEFTLPPEGGIAIPLKVLHTASWWNELKNVPLKDTDMRLDNVTRVELLTGALNVSGEHVVDLQAIRFHGKWISQGSLFLGLMGAWILAAIAWPLLTAYQLRDQLAQSRRRLIRLREINDALQLEARELAELANTDTLTGALNRQGLRATLLGSADEGADEVLMAVVFIDLDHFKSINDQHGHDVGDAVLREFVAAVLPVCRPSDCLARWGGEEFLLVCPGTNAEQAAELAERLRVMLHHHRWPAGLAITASLGLAAQAPGEEIGSVIKRADAALYEAKRAGRDQVVVSSAAPHGPRPEQHPLG